MSCHFFVFKEVAGLSLQLLPTREESHPEQFTHAARSSDAHLREAATSHGASLSEVTHDLIW